MKKRTTTAIVVVGGAGLLGLAAYLLLKPAATTPTTTAAAGARPFGDPNDQSSVAFACNAAWRLTALGRPTEAAHWVAICQAAGAVIPQNASQQYT
jgi:hypothetical protein